MKMSTEKDLHRTENTLPLYYKGRLVYLHTVIITVSSENHLKYTNALCGQNVELANVKPGGT
jgi:hypothetical protein